MRLFWWLCHPLRWLRWRYERSVLEDNERIIERTPKDFERWQAWHRHMHGSSCKFCTLKTKGER